MFGYMNQNAFGSCCNTPYGSQYSTQFPAFGYGDNAYNCSTPYASNFSGFYGYGTPCNYDSTMFNTAGNQYAGYDGFCGSSTPFSGWNNQNYAMCTPFSGWNNQNYAMSMPFSGWNTPFYGWNTPFYGWNTPFSNTQSSFQGWNNPFYGCNTPSQGWTMPMGSTPWTGFNAGSMPYGQMPYGYKEDENGQPTTNNFYGGAYGFGEKAPKTEAA